MFRTKDFAAQTLTDAGVIYINPVHSIEDVFEGSILFTAKGTKATGTFDCTAQLQGSNDSAFANSVDLGSPVVMSDTVNAQIALTGNTLYYDYYRVKLTGAGTQSTSVIGTYTAKGRR